MKIYKSKKKILIFPILTTAHHRPHQTHLKQVIPAIMDVASKVQSMILKANLNFRQESPLYSPQKSNWT